MKLLIGNRRYSSWSLRPWLVLHHFAIPFDDEVIRLGEADTDDHLAAATPAGKVPVLIDGDIIVWETLAIIEYLADRFSEKPIWPKNMAARAHARAVASEMHAGFTALRSACPMVAGARYRPKERGPDVARDLQRIGALWAEARQRFAGDGAFLYGDFSAADAMFAPVVLRIQSYGLDVGDGARNYMASVSTLPAMQEWLRLARLEPWHLDRYEADEISL